MVVDMFLAAQAREGSQKTQFSTRIKTYCTSQNSFVDYITHAKCRLITSSPSSSYFYIEGM